MCVIVRRRAEVVQKSVRSEQLEMMKFIRLIRRTTHWVETLSSSFKAIVSSSSSRIFDFSLLSTEIIALPLEYLPLGVEALIEGIGGLEENLRLCR